VTKIVTNSGGQIVTPQQRIRSWMQVCVSGIVLIVSLLILTSPHRIFPTPFDESTKRWAAGWVGAVIGYWLS